MDQKYPTPRGPAANAAKAKYNKNNYERINLAVPIGTKERIRSVIGNSSLNAFALEAINEKLERS